MTLPEFLAAEASLPFILGKNDCAHFIARWASEKTGRDGLAVYGGLPRDVAADLVARRQLLKAVMTGCRSIGLPRTKQPQPEDIGVIRVARSDPLPSGEVVVSHQDRCAIRAPSGWVYRNEAGLNSIRDEDCRLLMAWSTLCQHSSASMSPTPF